MNEGPYTGYTGTRKLCTKGGLHFSIGELIDRLTILLRKKRLIGNHFIKEYQTVKEALNSSHISGDFIEAISLLAEANYMIWEQEWEIRAKKLNNDKEIGKRTKIIRKWNTQRVDAKNKINEITKTGFIDIKKGHMSE